MIGKRRASPDPDLREGLSKRLKLNPRRSSTYSSEHEGKDNSNPEEPATQGIVSLSPC